MARYVVPIPVPFDPKVHEEPGNKTVKADEHVKEEKSQEPFVVPPADALIQPYAMVVHFLDAHVANLAVL